MRTLLNWIFFVLVPRSVMCDDFRHQSIRKDADLTWIFLLIGTAGTYSIRFVTWSISLFYKFVTRLRAWKIISFFFFRIEIQHLSNGRSTVRSCQNHQKENSIILCIDRQMNLTQDEKKIECGCISMFAVGLVVAAHLRRRYFCSFGHPERYQCVPSAPLSGYQIFSAKQAWPSVRLGHFQSAPESKFVSLVLAASLRRLDQP